MQTPRIPVDRAFSRAASALLAFLLLVIVWGAFVRASGSGAGCANHWPLCNGAIVPRAPAIGTLIELAHRVTSALLLIGNVALALFARRRFVPTHRIRRAALAALVFTLFEAAVGAAIVLLEKVGDDASIGRAVVMAVHLVNTFLLVASMTLSAWWSRGGAAPAAVFGSRHALAFGVGLAALLVLSATGAISALGDTLFPVDTLAEGFRQDLSPTAHVLLRLRFVHPLLALVTATGWIVLAVRFARSGDASMPARLGRLVVTLVTLQMTAGFANLLLLAPIPLQLAHLLLGDVTWIACLLLANEALAAEAEVRCYNEAPCVPTRSSPA